MASSATLTTTHLPQLRVILSEWHEKQSAPKGFRTELIPGEPFEERSNRDVTVAFRTRPPLPNEAEEKFKAVSDDAGAGEGGKESVTDPVEFCAGITLTSAEPGVFTAHVPGMKWTGPTLAHKEYTADIAFGPEIGNEEVYQRSVTANDILPLVLSGGVGCILAYGQTGSGKTYTMEGIESCIARDLFQVADTVGKRLAQSERPDEPLPSSGTDLFEFSVTFLELLGRRASDLVSEPEGVDASGNPIRKEVPIQEDKVGNVCPRLISTTVTSAKQLEELIIASLAHRRTSATLRNATSSRSHALLTIRIKNKALPYGEPGQLILVDLAGSERYEDSKAHDKQRMDESRDNNKSLMNLKDCVRAKAKMAAEDGFVHIPWRSNKLTMLLKPIFDIESRQPSRTVIIAHVSPHIQDTIHSTNTLGYAAPFKTNPPKPRGPAPYNPDDPRTWNHEQTYEWFKKQFNAHARSLREAEYQVKVKHAQMAGKKLVPLDNSPEVVEALELDIDLDKVIPPGYTAKNVGALYTTEWVQRCLAARIGVEDGSRKWSANETESVKNACVTVVGRLFYLIMSAKTKTRNEIMKTRKKLDMNDVYGDAPRWEDEDLDLDARIWLGDSYTQRVLAAGKKASEEGLSRLQRHEATVAEIRKMGEEWKAEKIRRMQAESEEYRHSAH